MYEHHTLGLWVDVWPKNICGSLWPIFHGPVILPYILNTIWCMNIIIWDYKSVWTNIWRKNKFRSLTYILWSGDFALYVVWHHTLGLWVCMTWRLTSSDFALYLQDYLGQVMWKRVLCHMQTTKVQISLRIRTGMQSDQHLCCSLLR